jgi:hypothetical protein
MAKHYLAALNPLLSEAQSGDEPIKVVIPAKGFLTNVREFDVAKMSANVEADIGTLKVRPAFLIGTVLKGLDMAGMGPGLGDEFPAQFTHLSTTIHNGQIQTNDVWLTAGRLTMGAKALMTHTPTRGEAASPWLANVNLAIGGNTLASIKGLTNIDPNSVLPLSLSGRLDQLKINPAQLAGPLLKLTGQAALADKLGGELGEQLGGAGDLLGGLLNRGGGGASGLASALSPAGSQWPNKPVIKAPTPEEAAAAAAQGQTPAAPTGGVLDKVIPGAAGAAGAGGVGGIIGDIVGGDDDDDKDGKGGGEGGGKKRPREQSGAQPQAQKDAQKATAPSTGAARTPSEVRAAEKSTTDGAASPQVVPQMPATKPAVQGQVVTPPAEDAATINKRVAERKAAQEKQAAEQRAAAEAKATRERVEAERKAAAEKAQAEKAAKEAEERAAKEKADQEAKAAREARRGAQGAKKQKEAASATQPSTDDAATTQPADEDAGATTQPADEAGEPTKGRPGRRRGTAAADDEKPNRKRDK